MKKITIIEDDPIISHIYRTRLEKEGYLVELCTDGQTGAARLHESKPDAVLLDLMLPKMNGVEFLKKIRAAKELNRLPIVVFTNAYVPNMIQESFAAGATEVFNKATLTPRAIIDTLHKLLYGPGAPKPAPAAATSPELTAPIPAIAQAKSNPGTASAPAPAAAPTAPTVRPNLSVVSDVEPAAAAPAPAEKASYPASLAPVIEAAAGRNDQKLQTEIIRSCKASAPDTLASLRKTMQDITKSPDEASRIEAVSSLYNKVHLLSGSSGQAGFGAIAQMSAALEVLLKELHEKPKNINASTLRTVAHSIDFMSDLFKLSDTPATESGPVNILVVDDEILSRRAITYALEKANLKSVSVEDPLVALNLSNETAFDLIFLDVQMPGLDGFDLCTKIRCGQQNKATPVIFVTSLTDFKSRAKSSLSGGTDLIAKPFMFIELGVKAITHVLRGRLNKRKLAQAA